MRSSFLARAIAAGLVVAFALAGCERRVSAGWQGYIEGEFVYIASPLAGRVEHVLVEEGATVSAGAPLFILDRAAELASEREAADRLSAAEARLEDLKKGLRPSELETLRARLAQARTAVELSQRELTRIDDLFKAGAVAASDFDRARLTHDRNLRVADELNAQLTTARLGGRPDAIDAAEAEVAAARAAKARAAWAVAEKAPVAPAAALVHDIVLRPGEIATVGAPVVVLLPPANVKVRFFVPETVFGTLKPGDRLRVNASGQDAPLEARISFLSQRPEYTPPVLYNRDNRAKLVFMVEGVFDHPVAALHPGQPVDVTRAP